MFGYSIKVGNTARKVLDDLSLYGKPLDLTDATVYWIMRHTTDQTHYLEALATVLDGPKALVEYRFTSGQTSFPGIYNCEWRVIFDDGTETTVPDNGHITLEIKLAVRRVGNL